MPRRIVLLTCLLALFLPLSAAAQGERVQFGQDIVVEADETAEEVVCFGCNVTVRGKVAGDVATFGGNIEIEGSVSGDVASFGGNIRLGATAEVGGDVATFGGRIDRDPQAKVGGKVETAPGLPVANLGALIALVVGLSLVTHIVLVLLTFLLAGRQRVETLAASINQRGGLTVLTGIGVLVALMVLFVLSFFTGPAMLILWVVLGLAFCVTLIVGYTGLSYWLGRALAKDIAPLAALLLGAVLITVAQLVPLVGLLLCLAFFLLALGCAVFSGFGTSADWLQRAFAGRAAAMTPPPPTG